MKLSTDHSYTGLPDAFWTAVSPSPSPNASWFLKNTALSRDLGGDGEFLASFGQEELALFAGLTPPHTATYFAQAYAGHQFGHQTMLGDGRCAMVGEVVLADGSRFDIQLKGSGPTPYSRRGDGKAALGPMVREYILGEAMTALGIPSTRALAVLTSGETIQRDKALPGALLVRVASSHLRVGTFEFAASWEDPRALQQLADYAIERHYPECAGTAQPYQSFFEAVSERQARLIASWYAVGFVHGVMNTDNMSISGETIDYGPCAFLDSYNPLAVFSSIDSKGRYAFSRQAAIAQWNLARFAEVIIPLFSGDEATVVSYAQGVLANFEIRFKRHYYRLMARKLGLDHDTSEDDLVSLVDSVTDYLALNDLNYTASFTALTDFQTQRSVPEALLPQHQGLLEKLQAAPWFAPWLAQITQKRNSAELMSTSNPVYIPRNHLVEEALAAASDNLDPRATEALVEVLRQPFQRQDGREGFELIPPPSLAYQTFCGT